MKGSCGKGCLFILGTKSGRLQINGGEMNDYENINEVPWYLYMENIKSISFENVKKIGNNCFNGATNLTEIIIPESVEVIGNNAFKECKSLENIVFKGKGCGDVRKALSVRDENVCNRLSESGKIVELKEHRREEGNDEGKQNTHDPRQKLRALLGLDNIFFKHEE